jgi:hypothetical protein
MAHAHDQRLRIRYVNALAQSRIQTAAALGRTLGLSAAEHRAHLRATRHAPDDWQPDEFDQFAALPPGRFDPRVFQQTTWWVDILRRPHRIADAEDFADEHLRAVLVFVHREAWRWAAFPELHDEDLVNVPWFIAESARRISQTPLVQALIEEAMRRGLTVPAAES